LQLDDEYLIRTFVKLRKTEPITAYGISQRVLKDTDYVLPLFHQVGSAATRDTNLALALRRVYREEATRRKCRALDEEAMRIKAQPSGKRCFLYADTRTNLPISYQDYELRYYAMLQAKRRSLLTMPFIAPRVKESFSSTI
jgi:hypothetical protein